MATPASSGRVAIWDAPTRIFHWLLVLLIPAMWWTAENDDMALHFTLGLLLVGMLVFRLVWGVMGSSTARFANFLKGPRSVRSYLNGSAASSVGHSPLGGWSVAAMIVALCVQVGLGLFAEDEDQGKLGPLSTWVDSATAARITNLHEIMFYVLLGPIVLHVAAILFYAVAKRRNLVGPMITGRGAAPDEAEPMRKASVIRLTFALAVAVAAYLWLWSKL
jgi:cytochrome b